MSPLEPRAVRRKDGAVDLENLGPPLLSALLDLPSLLRDDPPEGVGKRLFPVPTDDDERNDEWKRLVHPDLFALLASSRAIVERDLVGVHVGARAASRVRIPPKNVSAWVAALNAARLTIAETNGVGEREMSTHIARLPARQADAVVRIHVYGWLQQLLIEVTDPLAGE